MQSVGTRLREARIKKGYTLEEINARTRISLKNLNAIESDDLAKISSPFTYRSFVKQISDLLGLDHATLAADALEASKTMPEPLVPGQEEEPYVRPHQFQPQQKAKKSWNWVTMASLAGAAGVLFLYMILRNGGTASAKVPANSSTLPAASQTLPAVNQGAEPGQQSQPITPQPVVMEQQQPQQTPAEAQLAMPATSGASPTAVSQTAPSVVTVSQPAAVSQAAAPQQSVPPGTEQLMAPSQIAARNAEPAPVASTSSTGTTAVPGAAPVSQEPANIHIELSAIQKTRLSITADGKTTYNGTLGAMQTVSFEGKSTAQIWTANAGGVNIIFNGKALGSLGRSGQSRTFVFTKSGYEVVQGLGSNSLARTIPTGGQ